MRTLNKALVAGIAAIGVAGSCGWALAKDTAYHTLTVQLPDGATAHIRYTGNVAPKVTVGDAPFAAADVWGPASPFAALNRISAEVNRDMAAMMAPMPIATMPIATMPFWRPGPVFSAAFSGVPAQAMRYSIVSTGNGTCMRSMKITRVRNGKPKVVSHSAGDCHALGHAGFMGAPAMAPGHGGSMAMPTNIRHQDSAPVYEAAYRTQN